MEGLRLILSDGTIIENGRAGYAEGSLWLYLPGMSMMEAAMIAFDAEKTAEIIFQYGEEEKTYEGFTNCIRLMSNESEIAVCLVRGVNNG